MLTKYLKNFRDPYYWAEVAYYILCAVLARSVAHLMDTSAQLNIYIYVVIGGFVAGIIFRLAKGYWLFGKSVLFNLWAMALVLLPIAWLAPHAMRKEYALRLSDDVIVALIMFVFCFSSFFGPKRLFPEPSEKLNEQPDLS